jgi:TonB-dependent starch-binding outer membrane protein SusC
MMIKNARYIRTFFVLILFICLPKVFAGILPEAVEPDSGYSVPEEVFVSQPFFESTMHNVTSPVTVISGEQLESFPSANLAEALNGLVPSLQMTTTNYSPGNESVNFSVRGLNYTVIVDGLSGSLNNLSCQEIETVTILRGMSARAMYGSSAANGLIIVKTKQGDNNTKGIRVNLESGIKMTNFLPKWASAYDYANAYNQASINDGLTEAYSQEELDAYLTGSDPIIYPNIDLFNELMNQSMAFTRADFSYSGGSETTKYFMNIGYLGEGKGYMKYQDKSYDRVNFRSNVSTKISDIITLSLGFAGNLGLSRMPSNESSMWNAIGTYPVNAYPIMISPDTFGINRSFPFNPVADQTYSGITKRYSRSGLANVGLNFDLENITEGLTFDAFLSYDLYNYQQITGKNSLTYVVYEPQYLTSFSGADSLELIPVGTDNPDVGYALTNNSYYQQFGTHFKLGYNRQFGAHSIRSGLVYFFQQKSNRGAGQDIKNQDLSFTAQYAFKNKYLLDFIMSYTGTMQLADGNRFKAFPTLGLGWIISEEPFMQNMPGIDFLKLRTSYGSMGFFNQGDYFLYRTEYAAGGNYRFGSSAENLLQNYPTTLLSQLGNPNLTWGVMKEFDIGIDAAFFNNHMTIQLDYYNMNRENMIEDALYPAIMGDNIVYENYGINNFSGIDGYIGYTNYFGDFFCSGGLTFGYNTSEVVQTNEHNYPYDWMRRSGNPTDALFGFDALGLFESVDDITNSPVQYMGIVQEGNIKYTDLNNDGKIEQQIDEKMIGHTSPRYKLGLNLSLKYKGFGIYLLGVGFLDKDVELRNNIYYHADGNDKYSSYVIDNIWPGSTDNPRLTTTSTPNDNQRSSYWLVDGSYFKLKNLELSYELPKGLTEKLFSDQVHVFVRGVNLFTLSKIVDLDPEQISNGISDYPSMSTYTGGFSINF